VITAWLAITVAAVASPFREQQKERILQGLGIGDKQRPLAEIIDDQGRQHEKQPRGLNRPAAKMAEIVVEGLRPRDDKKYRAQRHQPDHAILDQERDPIGRIDRGKHTGIAGNLDCAGNGDDDEPDKGNRSEQRGNLGRAA
jgi:hypothetical protein